MSQFNITLDHLRPIKAFDNPTEYTAPKGKHANNAMRLLQLLDQSLSPETEVEKKKLQEIVKKVCSQEADHLYANSPKETIITTSIASVTSTCAAYGAYYLTLSKTCFYVTGCLWYCGSMYAYSYTKEKVFTQEINSILDDSLQQGHPSLNQRRCERLKFYVQTINIVLRDNISPGYPKSPSREEVIDRLKISTSIEQSEFKLPLIKARDYFQSTIRFHERANLSLTMTKRAMTISSSSSKKAE